MRILLIDGANLIHRARYGLVDGQYFVIYNFFRSFRSLVEQMQADKVIVALEGQPFFRQKLYPEYKMNRVMDPNNHEKIAAYQDFKKQREILTDILSRLPVEIVMHPEYEGDDLIGTLAQTVYQNDEVIVISADTDFIQLVPKVKLYNPIKKEFISSPNYSYLYHKALVGDSTDNISGIPKVGPKTAEKVLSYSEDGFKNWLLEKPGRKEIFERNLKLIQFAQVPIQEIQNLNMMPDFEYIKEKFQAMGFNSMLTEKAWNKFMATFGED